MRIVLETGKPIARTARDEAFTLTGEAQARPSRTKANVGTIVLEVTLKVCLRRLQAMVLRRPVGVG